MRKTLSVEEIGEICDVVHEVNPNAAVMVDNCYGEFTEEIEPTQVGADITAGSLIKNGRRSCTDRRLYRRPRRPR